MMSDNKVEKKSLLKLYIGKNYDKVNDNSYSYMTLLLGPIYLIYNNMFLYGITIIIFQNIIMLLLPYYYFSILYAITNLVLAIFFNKMYLTDAKHKLYKIFASTLDKEEIYDKIKKLKNRKSLGATLAVILYIVFALFTFNVKLHYNQNSYGRINKLNFNYSYDFKLENNTLYKDSGYCTINFNYSDLLDVDTILNYYEIIKPEEKALYINNNKWLVHASGNTTLYTQTNYNDLYFVKTTNIGNNPKCQEDIMKIIETFKIER